MSNKCEYNLRSKVRKHQYDQKLLVHGPRVKDDDSCSNEDRDKEYYRLKYRYYKKLYLKTQKYADKCYRSAMETSKLADELHEELANIIEEAKERL